jgi:hypothetical protein
LTLALAVTVLPTPAARRIATATLCIGISGLALAYVASEWLPLKLLLQGQPWRWLWIGRFAAIALLPLIGLYLWRAGKLGQCVATLLGSAWLLTDAGSTRDVEPFGVGGLLCLLALSIWLVRRRISHQVALTLWALSWCVLALVLLSFVSVIMVAASNHFTFGDEPVWVQRVTDVLYTPGIAALFVSGAWIAAFLVKGRTPAVFAAIVSSIVLIGAFPETVRRWTDTPFGESHRAEFAAWRAKIPTDSEVLWNEAPQAVWFLLDRRSYLTVSQAAGTVFSRETTVEITRRANALSPLVAPGTWVLDPSTREEKMRDLTAPILRGICRAPSLGFVVSEFDVGGAALRAEWPGKADYVYLYDCRDFRYADS